jgi:hypothetical protein
LHNNHQQQGQGETCASEAGTRTISNKGKGEFCKSKGNSARARGILQEQGEFCKSKREFFRKNTKEEEREAFLLKIAIAGVFQIFYGLFLQ